MSRSTVGCGLFHAARRPGGRVLSGILRVVMSLSLALVLSAVVRPSAASAATVTFSDSNLESAVRAALAKPTGTITDADMLSLVSLTANGSGIRSLSGLEYAANLSSVSLNDNDISDLTPLSDLKRITVLNLVGNEISDIRPLAGVTSLETLRLGTNPISDISAVRGLTNLRLLGFIGDRVSDISPVEGLVNLEYLVLDDNLISDISPVSGLHKLVALNLASNAIEDISPVQGLSTLDHLDLSHNRVSDTSPLVGLDRLSVLNLSHNDIVSLASVEGRLNNLWTMDISGNRIVSFPPAAGGLANLHYLTARLNRLDLTPGSYTAQTIAAFQAAGRSVEYLPQKTDADTFHIAATAVGPGSIAPSGLCEVDTGCDRVFRMTPAPGYRVADVVVDGVSAGALGSYKFRGVTGNHSIQATFEVIGPEDVTFADPALEAAVRAELAKPTGPITTTDMQSLVQLTAENSGIRDLAGLESAVNLQALDLIGNQVSDISRLSGLAQLQGLALSGNRLTSVEPLRGLARLQVLLVGGNQIRDVSAVGDLWSLVWLDVSGNRLDLTSGSTDMSSIQLALSRGVQVAYSPQQMATITSSATGGGVITPSGEQMVYYDSSLAFAITPDAEYRISDVRVDGASVGAVDSYRFDTVGSSHTIAAVFISSSGAVDLPDDGLEAAVRDALSKPSGDITVADMERLVSLDGVRRGIQNLTGLEHAVNLVNLDLEGNQITDLGPLGGLAHLSTLDLQMNRISSIAPLSRLAELEFLILDSNQITDVSPVSGLVSLDYLGVNGNRVTSAAPLAGLTQLSWLGVSGNQITDIAPLSGLTELRGLWIGQNPLGGIGALEGLTSLEYLFVGQAQISDITPIAGLTRLVTLDLTGNRISDITPLAGATHLSTLWVGRNQISSIAVLSGLTELSSLLLEDNEIHDIGALRGIAGLDVVQLSLNHLDVTPGSSDMDVINVLLSQGASVTYLPQKIVTVTFPDAKLEAAVRMALSKPNGSITSADMQSLTMLSVRTQGVRDLRGLEYATNLTTLMLDGNAITDIAPLAGMDRLELVYLANNSITDIAPLAGMKALKSAFLGGNSIADISVLGGLPQLEELDLDINRVTDISPLAGLTNLRVLTMRHNDLSDISLLSGLTNLRHLSLSGNRITDVSPLAGMTKMENLVLERNQISDISPLAGMHALRSLFLRYNQVADISVVAGMPGLNYLIITANRVTDISPSAGLTSLTYFEANENEIRDITPVAGLSNLETLYVGSNQVADVSPVAGLTKLRSLDLTDNVVSDISPLAGMQALAWLGLDDNRLIDIGATLDLPALQWFNVKRNYLDLSAGSPDLDVIETLIAQRRVVSYLPQRQCTTTPSAGPNGSISPAEVRSAPCTFTITPDPGYHVADVVVDGVSVGPVASYSFAFDMREHTISATFAINTYTLAASANAHGSVSPSGTQTVEHGAGVSYAITADAGYHVYDVVVDGVSAGAVSQYTFTNVTADHTLRASFAADYSTRYENTDPMLAYETSWTVQNSSSRSGGNWSYVNRPCAAANIAFDGTRLALVSSKAANFGIASVTVDGGERVLVDLYSASAKNKQTVFDTGDLAEGRHSVRVEWTGNKNANSTGATIGLDAVDVWGTLGQAAVSITRCENTDPRLAYEMAWTVQASTSRSGGDWSSVNLPCAAANIAFEGTSLTLISTKASSYGIASVSVDGGEPTPVDLYSAATMYQQPVFSTGALADGPHTVRVEWTGTRNASSSGNTIGIDAIDLRGTLSQAVSPVTRCENADARIAYETAWTVQTSTSRSGGNWAYVNRPCAAANIAFDGTNLTLISGRAPSYGIAKVIVDGGEPVLVDLYSAVTAYRQPVYSTGALASGPHTVRVEWTGTKNPSSTGLTIGIDAVDLWGTPTQAVSPITRYEDSDGRIAYETTWTVQSSSQRSGGSWRYVNKTAAANIAFEGASLTLISTKSTSYGIAKVIVDGGEPVLVDLYSAVTAYQQPVFSTGVLASGPHTVRVEWTGTRNASSTGTTIGLDAVDLKGVLAQASRP